MWSYEKRLQHPVNITCRNPRLAQVIMSQFGGPDGELAASMRYLSQRYSTKNRKVAGVLTDIGTEELVPVCDILRTHSKPLSIRGLSEVYEDIILFQNRQVMYAIGYLSF